MQILYGVCDCPEKIKQSIHCKCGEYKGPYKQECIHCQSYVYQWEDDEDENVK
jgi:hypothetical protein